MTRTLAVLESPPKRGALRHLSDTNVGTVALTREIAAECSRSGLEVEVPARVREDHLIYPADERAIRWAAEFMEALRTGGAATTHCGIELDLMLEGRLKFYFFRRLALFYTQIEALLRGEGPGRLVLATNDRLFVDLARDLAERHGASFGTVPARAAGLQDRDSIRRRHRLRYAALLSYEIAQALRPSKRTRVEGPDGAVVLFAESHGHIEMTEPVFRALRERGRFGVLVAHRSREMSRPGSSAERFAPLDAYLTPAGLSAMLATMSRWNARWPRAAAIGSRAPDAEWRSLAGAARREAVSGALVFVTGLIERIRRLASAHRPQVGITLSEMGAFGQTIARAGRRFGMATLNMEHGLKTHLPMVEAVVSDRIAAFGEESAEVLVRQGADPAAIVLTGAPRYDALFRREGLPERAETLARMGLDETDRLIVFASYPLAISATHSAEHKEAIVRALAEAVEEIPNGALVVKLHPLETDPIAERVLSMKPRPRFRVVGDVDGPLYPLLAACDVLATFTSTTALEAAILGRSILVVNLSGLPDTTPYVREGIALYADSAGAVGPALARLLDDEALRGQLEEARRRFIRRFATSDDGRAAERVADLILEMVRERRGR